MTTLEQRKNKMGLSSLVIGTPDHSSAATSPVDKLTESGRFVIGDFIIARDGNVEERPPRGLSRLGAGNGAAPPTGALGAQTGGTPAGLERVPAPAVLGRVPHNLPPPPRRAASVGGDPSSAASRLTAAGPGGEPLDWSKLQIGEMLGRGASGYVRRARLGKQEIAVKRIAISDGERRQQTFNEISALVGVSDLGAANLATCYGVRYIDGNIEIAMEFMDLGSLGDRLRARGPLPEEALGVILAQTLAALHHLHKEMHAVHRDLKPQNLLLSSSGQAKLSDFGCVAELQDSFGKCGTFVGTVPYMSPERIHGGQYSYASDIWSLGLTTVEAALGHFPYARFNGYWGILHAVLNEPSPELPSASFSSEICDFVAHCLRKEAAERPSARVLLQHPFIVRARASSFSLRDFLCSEEAAAATTASGGGAGGAGSRAGRGDGGGGSGSSSGGESRSGSATGRRDASHSPARSAHSPAAPAPPQLVPRRRQRSEEGGGGRGGGGGGEGGGGGRGGPIALGEVSTDSEAEEVMEEISLDLTSDGTSDALEPLSEHLGPTSEPASGENSNLGSFSEMHPLPTSRFFDREGEPPSAGERHRGAITPPPASMRSLSASAPRRVLPSATTATRFSAAAEGVARSEARVLRAANAALQDSLDALSSELDASWAQLGASRFEAQSLRQELQASQYSDQLLCQQCDEAEGLVKSLKAQIEALELQAEIRAEGEDQQRAPPRRGDSAPLLLAADAAPAASAAARPPSGAARRIAPGEPYPSAYPGGDGASMPVSLDGRVLTGLHPADLERLCALTERNLHEIRAAMRRTNGRMRAPSAVFDRAPEGRHAERGFGGAAGSSDLALAPAAAALEEELSVVGGRAPCTSRPASSTTARREVPVLTPKGRRGEAARTPTAQKAARPKTPTSTSSSAMG